MKIQLIEPFQGGHYTNYVEALLPAFRRYLENSVISEVVVSITPAHFALLQRNGSANTDGLRLTFDATFPAIGDVRRLPNRFALYRAHSQAVQNVRADAFIRTTADYDIACNALLNAQNKHKKNVGVRSVGLFHYGYPRSEHLNWKEQIKQGINDIAWQHSDWDSLMFVNPIIYESVLNQSGFDKKQIRLLPDPAPPSVIADKFESRVNLGIPTDGFYLGFVGMMDGRKAIPELLAAFAQANADVSCRLLLMGRMEPAFSELLNTKYAHLVESGRIIVMNRFLSAEEVHWGYAAIDVHTLLQYRRMNLSANLLKAVAYGKPVVVDAAGYTGIISQRFALGEVCDVLSLQSTSDAIQRAIARAPRYVPTPQAKRLSAFHHPDNYANSIMQELLPNQSFDVKTWDWVNQA
jgi:glycosyltransferase involved in cell wall biosynthesis